MFLCSRVHGHIYFSQSKHSEGFLGFQAHSSSVEHALGLTWWLSGKASTCACSFLHWVRKMPWRTKRRSALALLPGKSRGQRNPARLQSIQKQVGHNLAAKPPKHAICLCFRSSLINMHYLYYLEFS